MKKIASHQTKIGKFSTESNLQALRAQFPDIDREIIEDIFENFGKDFELSRQHLSIFAEEQAQEQLIISLHENERKSFSKIQLLPEDGKRIQFVDDDIKEFFLQEKFGNMKGKSPPAHPSKDPVCPQSNSVSKSPNSKIEKEIDMMFPIQKSKKKKRQKIGTTDDKTHEPEKQSSSTALSGEEHTPNEEIEDEEKQLEQSQVMTMIKHELLNFQDSDKDVQNDRYFSELINSDIVKVQEFIEQKYAQQHFGNSFESNKVTLVDIFPASYCSSKEIPLKYKPKALPKALKKTNPFEVLELSERKQSSEYNSKPPKDHQTKPSHPQKSSSNFPVSVTNPNKKFKNDFLKSNPIIEAKSGTEHLLQLHEIFPRLNFLRLQFIYESFEQDFDNTKEFLLMNFKEFYQPLRKKQNNKSDKQFQSKEILSYRNYFSAEVMESVDAYHTHELDKHLSEVRKELHDCYKYYSVTSKCAYNIRLNPAKYNSSFDSLKKHLSKKIEYLKELEQYIVFKRSKDRDFEAIDLHYLFLDEAIQVLYTTIEVVRQRIEKRGQGSAQLEVITGKGKHSKEKAVLFPEVLKSLKENGYKVTTGEGTMLVQLYSA